VLAALLEPRGVFAAAMVLPALIIASVVFIPTVAGRAGEGDTLPT